MTHISIKFTFIEKSFDGSENLSIFKKKIGITIYVQKETWNSETRFWKDDRNELRLSQLIIISGVSLFLSRLSFNSLALDNI